MSLQRRLFLKKQKLGGLSGFAKSEAIKQWGLPGKELAMAFGPNIGVKDGEVRLLLRALSKGDIPTVAKGMASRKVTQYLGITSAPTLEQEEEWYQKTYANELTMLWGIEWQGDNDARQVIGVTGLHNLSTHPVSGCQIFCPEFWGRGIATAAHVARTAFAFEQLGLIEVRSGYLAGNEASGKALKRLGHVEVGIDGKWRSLHKLLLINPNEPAWSYFWDGETPPEEFKEAREKTLAVLEKAEKTVTFK